MDDNHHYQRASWPRRSHSSLDRQRNDRVGRTGRRHLFEHWRKILRRIRSYTYTYGDCYTDANSYSYSYGHAYAYTNANPVLGAVYTDAATSP